MSGFVLPFPSIGQSGPGGIADTVSCCDLKEVRQAVRDKRVIAVGEATHGSKEFVLLKSQLFIELYRHNGVTDLAIEMPYSIGPEITDYINGLTPFTYIDSLLLPAKTFYSQEFFAFLEKLKRFNMEQNAGIRIHGIDIDQSYGHALNGIRKLLLTKSVVDANTLDSLAVDIPKDHRLLSIDFKAFSNEKTGAAIQSVSQYLEKLGPSFSNADRDRLRRFVRQLTDSYTYFNTGSLKRYVRRDRMMAGYVMGLLTTIPSGRLVIWAHNDHVRMADGSSQRMGEVLQQNLGDGYFSIGTVFSEGSYRVYYKGVLQPMRLEKTRAGELADHLHSIRQQSSFVLAMQLPAFLQNRKVDVYSVGIVQPLDLPKANKETINTTKDYHAYFYFPTVRALDPVSR